jgi:hypothetical protein
VSSSEAAATRRCIRQRAVPNARASRRPAVTPSPRMVLLRRTRSRSAAPPSQSTCSGFPPRPTPAAARLAPRPSSSPRPIQRHRPRRRRCPIPDFSGGRLRAHGDSP